MQLKPKQRLAILLTVFALLLSYPILGQSNREKPALMVGIIVDGLRYDWITRYWDIFGDGGIRKLIRQGTSYTNATIPYLLADVSNSCAAISTGAPPAINGIVADSWYNRLRREQEFATRDFLAKGIGVQNGNGKHSAGQLMSNTLGDELIRSSDYKGKVISVSFRAEPAILLTGHIPGSAYWFDAPSGNWITSSQFANTLPEWVLGFNSRNTASHYLTRDWDLLLADNLYKACPPDDNDLETGFYNQFKTFPYKINRIRKESLGQDNEILGMMPFGNTLTTDFATTALLQEGLGKDGATDILYVCYTAINEITRRFGPDSREVADALIRLDMDIQRLVYQIEESVGKDKSLFFLTSTHGASMDPDYSQAINLPGGFFRQHNALALLNSYLSAIHGDGEWIESYNNLQVYLNESLIDQKNLSFALIQDQVARFLTHFDGVARAIPADRFIGGELTNPWGDLLQNSFNPDRSGDIILILQPGWIEDNNNDSDSRSPYSYDTHIPLVWYGWKTVNQSINRPVSLLDISPTLANILAISSPGGATGEILHDLLK